MDPVRLPPIDLLVEVLHGYRHPAAVNPVAVSGVDEADAKVYAAAANWPSLAVFQTPDGQNFMLRRPTSAVDSLPPAAALPPRVGKIARLVIDGLTDKQIAQRVGLTFSTVRTYVRQIYRRVGVHSRVGLVHASRAELLPSSPVGAGQGRG
ncbi:MAG: response regulator transcription factor [Myxococcales bacterium]|nr:response regulator transcription factor [Myxococcales bacterium]